MLVVIMCRRSVLFEYLFSGKIGLDSFLVNELVTAKTI